MAPTQEASLLPSVPSEVTTFAARLDLGADLPAVLMLARRIFPSAPLSVRLEEDPEIGDDWHIVIEADSAGMTVPEIVAAHEQWTRELLECCPTAHAPIFRLGMV